MIDLNRNIEIISDSNDSIIADGANFDLANDIILLKKISFIRKTKIPLLQIDQKL